MSARGAGVLPIDKPEGPTSHDIVGATRRALGTRRVGHTGTLDPFASGLLLLCIGPATRLSEYLTPLPKSYTATAQLGVETDTADRTGEPVHIDEGWRELTRTAVEDAVRAQEGTIEQVPPAFSAKKVQGERAYERARRGESVRLEPVRVTIHRITIRELELPEVTFEVECSAGTYIRAIARDIGAALGVGGHLTHLRRTRIGTHSVEQAVPLDQLDDATSIDEAWITPLDALDHLARLDVDEEAARFVYDGRAIPVPAEEDTTGGPVALAHDNTLVAVGEIDDRRFLPRKVFPRV